MELLPNDFIMENNKNKEETRKKRAENIGSGEKIGVTLDGLLAQVYPEQKAKKAGGKAPPKRFSVILTGIDQLAKIKSKEYRIDNENQISIPHRNQKILKSIKKELETETDPEKITDLNEAYKQAYENVRHWSPISNGCVITISVFKTANLTPKLSTQLISCINVFGDASDDGKYNNFQCAEVLSLQSNDSLWIKCAKHFNIRDLKFDIKREQNLLLFADIARPYGPNVISQNYVDFVGCNCIIQKENEPEKAVLDMTLWQRQPDAKYCIMGKIWGNELASESSIFDRFFGIRDPKLFAKIMTSHKVNCIAVCSINHQKTIENDETIHVYLNNPNFLIREYLLSCGLKISFNLVKELLLKDKDAKDRPDKLCLVSCDYTSALNKANDKVINASFFSGNIAEVNKMGYEWRALHTMDPYFHNTRVQEGHLSVEEAELKIKMCTDIVIYAVMPYTDAEKVYYCAPAKEPEHKKVKLEEKEEEFEEEEEENY
jgi:hypothetical protein